MTSIIGSRPNGSCGKGRRPGNRVPAIHGGMQRPDEPAWFPGFVEIMKALYTGNTRRLAGSPPPRMTAGVTNWQNAALARRSDRMAHLQASGSNHHEMACGHHRLRAGQLSGRNRIPFRGEGRRMVYFQFNAAARHRVWLHDDGSARAFGFRFGRTALLQRGSPPPPPWRLSPESLAGGFKTGFMEFPAG